MQKPSGANDKKSRIIGLAGNPNVGKSTVFNQLTGLKQHTGNWTGKTVSNAVGAFTYNARTYTLVDMPGTYSVLSGSYEEEIARDYILYGDADVIVVVADATCLERNLILLLQILEITKSVVLCVNLMDEAKKKRIGIDTEKLRAVLSIPVVETGARSGVGLDALQAAIEKACADAPAGYSVTYAPETEAAIEQIQQYLADKGVENVPLRWLALRILENDRSILASVLENTGFDCASENHSAFFNQIRAKISRPDGEKDALRDAIGSAIVADSEKIFRSCASVPKNAAAIDRKIDNILTTPFWGTLSMLALLFVVFWLTITGANYPSQLLQALLFKLEDYLYNRLSFLPAWAQGVFIGGMYRTLAWVVSVMLPPMAIFFPLFTLLEDLGYLPRVAFNLDRCFHAAGTHGKQSLTMCMGFGCNACGVTGCRIIDSPRERLVAILTNNFVPCNGRFPTMIAIIAIFFTASVTGIGRDVLSSLILVGVILLGIGATLLLSKLLTMTLLRGEPSSFALELPPYRAPQVGKVLVRSLLDRTVFVLGRAVSVAMPAGIVIWVLANVTIGDVSLLRHISAFLDPFARQFGLDGIILMAFILGFPANEIVLPIILMSYMSTGTLTDFASLAQLRTLLIENGWTLTTAICVTLFSLMHFPCATTMLTIFKETRSAKWTALAFVLPTLTGLLLCFILSHIL